MIMPRNKNKSLLHSIPEPLNHVTMIDAIAAIIQIFN
jgi:hypothetical protein